MEKYEKNFIIEAENHGHVLKVNEDGEIDLFAMSYEYHNGPICILCDNSWCVHCHSPVYPCTSANVSNKAIENDYESIILAMTLDLENNFKDQTMDKLIEENK